MPQSLHRIWVHTVWATKYRMPLIETKIESEVYEFLRKQFIASGCPVRIINGMPDHVHCLFLLNYQKSISDIIKQIKGSSSFFINEKKLTTEKFAWQGGYSVFSVSEEALEKVYQYIKNQKRHHSKTDFEQEFRDLEKSII